MACGWIDLSMEAKVRKIMMGYECVDSVEIKVLYRRVEFRVEDIWR